MSIICSNLSSAFISLRVKAYIMSPAASAPSLPCPYSLLTPAFSQIDLWGRLKNVSSQKSYISNHWNLWILPYRTKKVIGLSIMGGSVYSGLSGRAINAITCMCKAMWRQKLEISGHKLRNTCGHRNWKTMD